MNAISNARDAHTIKKRALTESPTGDSRADQALAKLMALTEDQRRFYAHFNWLGQEYNHK